MNPKLSGYAQLHGEFNYNTTPLDPPGTKIIVHEKPTLREIWAAQRARLYAYRLYGLRLY